MDAEERKPPAKGGKEPRPRKLWLWTGIRLLVYGGLLLVVVAILARYYFSRYPGSHRISCDRAASANVGKIAMALERFGNELIDMGCSNKDEILSGLSENGIGYLLGPFYGWNGTIEKCGVRIRVVDERSGDAVCEEPGLKKENVALR